MGKGTNALIEGKHRVNCPQQEIVKGTGNSIAGHQ